MTTCRLCPGEARPPGAFCVAYIEAANKRRGLELTKTRRRDERALDYGGYWLLDTHGVVAGGEYGISLAEIAVELLS